MRKISIILLVVLAFFIFELKTVLAGVTLYFNFEDVSETYVKFTYEFGGQFVPQAKKYRFLGDYRIWVLEGRVYIIDQDNRTEEELVIGVIINEAKIPFVWVKVNDLANDEIIKEKAKEFGDKVLKELKELERLKEPDKKAGKNYCLRR